MPFSFRKSSARAAVGLDIDGSFVAAVQTSGPALTRAASMELRPGLVGEGEVLDSEGLAEALKVFFDRNSLPRVAQLGVANQQIAVRQLELPVLEDGEERDAAVRFQAAEAIPMPLDEVVLDYKVVGERKTQDGAQLMAVVVVAARESMITRLMHSVRAAGVKPAGIDLNAFALVRVLAGPEDPALPASSGQDRSARVYCHLGGVTNLAIATGSSCLFTRSLSTVWDNPNDDTAGALAEEIRLSIDSYVGQADSPPVADVVLSGPGATRDGFAAELDSVLALPVSVADPLGYLVDALPAEEDPYAYTVAAGLALAEAG
jgi:type IV pilus assembly protein PilM